MSKLGLAADSACLLHIVAEHALAGAAIFIAAFECRPFGMPALAGPVL